MRLLLASESYYPNVDGGAVAERQLALRMAARGHDVAVIAPSFRGLRGDREQDGGTVIHRAPAVRFAPYPEYRMSVLPGRFVRRVIARFRPDVVHVHNPYPIGLAAAREARRRGIPLVGTNHLMPENFFLTLPWAQALHRPLARAGWRLLTAFYGRCAMVIAPSRTAVGLLRRHGLRAPARAVSNGVDLGRFRPGPDDGLLRRVFGLPSTAPVVLYTGRLGGEKSLHVLLRAFAGLDRRKAAHLVLSGTGPDGARLRSLASALGIAARTRFVGFVPDRDLPALYRLAAVFVIPSTAELQSIVTLEAMASGLPVAAADSHALPELVRPGRNGVLFPPGDPHALGAALRRLLADPSARRRMGRASRRLVAPHDYGRVIGEFERLYREVIQSHEDSGRSAAR